jgi:hypothetical protein
LERIAFASSPADFEMMSRLASDAAWTESIRATPPAATTASAAVFKKSRRPILLSLIYDPISKHVVKPLIPFLISLQVCRSDVSV